jgi:phenylpyruvate tautomerase PptA (4-oxalocrotonate tautomerase family)
MNEIELIEKLTKAIVYKYKNTSSTASLLISYLPTEEYYVSIVKYGSSYDDKKLIHSVRSHKLFNALKTIF